MKVRVRPGSIDDHKALIDFYTRERSADLPAPSSKDLATALADGRLIIVESDEGILGCAAQIPFTATTCNTFVGELTGTRVTAPLSRGKPINFQTLLLGLRVLHHAALMGEVLPPASHSLITIIKKNNEGSLKNVRKAKFVECKALPDWFKYDELAWHGAYVVDEWEYFIATHETVRHLANELVSNGLLDWKMTLATASGPTEVSLVGFRDLEIAADDIRMIASGALIIDLAPLPPELLF